uniref:Uncharacterized protein n=1 Tax=Anopheles coluzzii TaxID=1518534 RepID=A0A8W7PTM2_ANOCL
MDFVSSSVLRRGRCCGEVANLSSTFESRPGSLSMPRSGDEFSSCRRTPGVISSSVPDADWLPPPPEPRGLRGCCCCCVRMMVCSCSFSAFFSTFSCSSSSCAKPSSVSSWRFSFSAFHGVQFASVPLLQLAVLGLHRFQLHHGHAQIDRRLFALLAQLLDQRIALPDVALERRQSLGGLFSLFPVHRGVPFPPFGQLARFGRFRLRFGGPDSLPLQLTVQINQLALHATVALFRCEERPAAVNNPGSLSEVELSSSAAAPDVGEVSDTVGPPAGPFFCRSRAEELSSSPMRASETPRSGSDHASDESPVTEIDMLRLRDKSRLRSTALRIAFRLSVDSDPISSLFRSSESRKPASSSSRCVEIAHRSAYSLRHFWAFSASSRALISSSFSCLMMMLRSFRWSPAPPLPHSLWISVSFFCCSSFARCTSASYSAWLTGLRSWSTISGTASAATPARAPVAPPFMPCSE